MKIPDFQKTHNSCEIFDTSFEELLEEESISPDEFLYKVRTNQGIFYIFTIDYISSLADIRLRISSVIGDTFTFIPRKIFRYLKIPFRFALFVTTKSQKIGTKSKSMLARHWAQNPFILLFSFKLIIPTYDSTPF
jgi:hypothetical protein